MTLTIEHISKRYHNFVALDNINLTFEDGHIYGLLGRNGAGKSTLLNIINNRIFASEGSVTLDGEPVSGNETALNQIFLMSEDNLYPDDLTVKRAFKMTERFYGGFNTELAEKLVQTFHLKTKARFKKLSTGYRSIAKLIIALCVPAKYIFLDEPVLGLDANHRDVFYRVLLDNFIQNPRTFIISTHLIEEIANIVDEVVILHHGQVIDQSSTERLKTRDVTISGPEKEVSAYTANLEVLGQDQLGGLLSVYIRNFTGSKEDLPEGLTLAPLNLQNYFIQLTSEEDDLFEN